MTFTRRRKMALLAGGGVAAGWAMVPQFVQRFGAEEVGTARVPFHAPVQGAGQPAGRSAARPPWDAVALGRVEPLSREIRIAASVPGRIAEVLVRATDKVFAGELLGGLPGEEAAPRVAPARPRGALATR